MEIVPLRVVKSDSPDPAASTATVVNHGDLDPLPDRSLTTLTTAIRDYHLACEANARQAVEYAILAGELLAEVKAQVGHGAWGSWLEAHFPGTQQLAAAYMRMAANREQIENAPSIRGALKQLAAPKTEGAIRRPTEHNLADFLPANPIESAARALISQDEPLGLKIAEIAERASIEEGDARDVRLVLRRVRKMATTVETSEALAAAILTHADDDGFDFAEAARVVPPNVLRQWARTYRDAASAFRIMASKFDALGTM